MPLAAYAVWAGGEMQISLALGHSSDPTRPLLQGARLTALDLSDGMVAVARERAATFAPGAPARFLVAGAEDGEPRVSGCWAEPAALSSWRTTPRVRTTPFTCGTQASLTSAIFTTGPSSRSLGSPRR